MQFIPSCFNPGESSGVIFCLHKPNLSDLVVDLDELLRADPHHLVDPTKLIRLLRSLV